jgi:hypothetical protein
LIRSSPLIAGNLEIIGGCATAGDSVGILSEDGGSRIENNVIVGGFCGDDPMRGRNYTGLRALGEPGSGRELDVNGNVIASGNTPFACSGTAIEIGALASGSLATGALGLYRNIIVRPGTCTGTSNRGVSEANAASDPRVFEHNLFDDTAPTPALYFDEGIMPLGPGALGPIGPGLIVGNPVWSGFFGNGLVDPTSPANGAGTAVGLPATDIEGNPRPIGLPDIGADED